jgi:methylenetetrahydrofolate dehydrogenase (NADP+)/methenyltetrahydrofolate cyclohydrolase
MINLEGKEVAMAHREKIKREIEEQGIEAGLAVILVGDDPASKSYVASKEKACREAGIRSIVFQLKKETSEEEVLKKIEELNLDASITGILVQIPLPDHIDENRVVEKIDPWKDVDGLHPFNFGKLFMGNSVVEPCTPKGIIHVLDHYKIDLAGKNAVVLGRSNIVGKPIAALLLQRNATVTICHSKTKNLKELSLSADILVAAIGKPLFVTAEMVKEGAVVIDVGINRIEDKTKLSGYRVVGDVDFESVSRKASAITPVPGGVGLLTIAMLLDNTLTLARIQQAKAA